MKAARKMIAVEAVGNAVLLWLAYEWLGMGESTQLRLVGSALAALALITAACWLHGAALVLLREGDDFTLGAAFRRALKTLPALTGVALAALVLYGLLAWAAFASGQPAFRLASWLTLKLRTPVKPATVANLFLFVFLVVRWVVLPVGLAPAIVGIATRGWRGITDFTWRCRWMRWIEVPGLLLAAFILPLMVIRWVPRFGGFGLEMASFILRVAIAFGLFVASLWLLEYRAAVRQKAPESGAADAK
jgi:hypothetical protein